MLTQLAAATAQKGTNLPTKGGADLTRVFNDKAVPRAPAVAMTYDIPSWLILSSILLIL